MPQKIKYNKEQVLVAKYSGESRFRIPEGIDIQTYLDSGKAYVRWNTLCVELGEDVLKIECHQDAEDNIDWKRGDEVRVEDRDEDFDKEDEDEEEDEEDKVVDQLMEQLEELKKEHEETWKAKNH